MRKILFGVVVTLMVLFTFRYCSVKAAEENQLKTSSALIEKQVKHVGKLVVTEGHFSQVFNYKNAKAYFGDWLNAEKKALVVVNAEVSVLYDLSLLEYNIDETTKTLEITHIPKEEIKIHPELEYYDVQADFFNPFQAEDHNKIRAQVKQALLKKIESSGLKANAKNRLLSELSKCYILTSSLGWTLKYHENPITSQEQLQTIKL
ncbi:MAG: DUF4230 domain-containing protein [Algicola sp.]|nr:DUF4230 domain-containing protein [Algicola sp.]